VTIGLRALPDALLSYEGLGTLNMAEAQTLDLVLSRVSAALARATDAKHFYTYSRGERVPQVSSATVVSSLNAAQPRSAADPDVSSWSSSP